MRVTLLVPNAPWGTYHSWTHQPQKTPSLISVSTCTVPIPGSVGSQQEEATATTNFFEILALILLGAELLPLPRNRWITVIFGSFGRICRVEAKRTVNACLSVNPYLVSCALFSPARSSVVYHRYEFLGKSSGLSTFGFLTAWGSASAFTAYWWSQRNPHCLLSA